MLQKVAEETILHSTRISYHKNIATWYEENEEDITTVYSILSYHWLKAEYPEKSSEYKTKATAIVHFGKNSLETNTFE